MQANQADVAVIGGGIVGLAHALVAARRGMRVVVFERDNPAVGASIRNFGLIWPVGQPDGPLQQRALQSRDLWLEVCQAAGLWCAPTGSLHLAYHTDEEQVLLEYLETTPASRDLGRTMLTPDEVARKSGIARREGLCSALWSPTEVNVDPRQAIRVIPHWLAATYGVELRFGSPVKNIALPVIETSTERWQVEQVFVCSGNDFETLFPEEFAATGITRCKLQMLRTAPQSAGWQPGPALCAGLTLLHYAAFRHCVSLAALRERLCRDMPFYCEQFIHVLLSQTSLGEFTIGDHHTYGWTHDPFAYDAIDQAILSYLHTFATIPHCTIAERWIGIYPLVPGQSELVLHPAPGVTIVNGLGGAGMTLSFGLAEELLG